MEVASERQLLARFVGSDSTLLEIGAGDCALSFAMAKVAKTVLAVDVSDEITRGVAPPWGALASRRQRRSRRRIQVRQLLRGRGPGRQERGPRSARLVPAGPIPAVAATPKPMRESPDPERRPSQQDLAAGLIAMVAERHPGRRVDVVGDSAFACKVMGALGDPVTLTSRLRANAVIHAPKPPPTGKRGRPRVTGERLGSPAEIVAAAKPGDWQTVRVPAEVRRRSCSCRACGIRCSGRGRCAW